MSHEKVCPPHLPPDLRCDATCSQGPLRSQGPPTGRHHKRTPAAILLKLQRTQHQMRVCPISSLVVRAYLTHVPRDEFAEVKAVKLLRRGRRLQQVEYVPISHFQPHQRLLIIHHRAVYGKTCDSPLSQKSSTSALVIPQLKVEFLQSPFFRRFCVQRTRPFSHHR